MNSIDKVYAQEALESKNKLSQHNERFADEYHAATKMIASAKNKAQKILDKRE